MDNDQDKNADDGIQPVSGRLSRQIERTQKMNMPAGGEAEKYWMRPMAPAEQLARGMVNPDILAQLQVEIEEEIAAGDIAIEPLPNTPEPIPEPAAPEEPEDEGPPETYRAYVVTEQGGEFHGEICEQPLDSLPDEDLLVEVAYSSLNHKDALVASGFPGIAKGYPQVPGIDAVGTVVRSSKQSLKEGDVVIVGGNELGTTVPGGFGEYIQVPVNWAVPLPDGLSPRESMAYGTAGFTAGLCVHRLTLAGLRPRHGRVLVTGATGGVGSFAIGILASAGFTVTAATGKPHEAGFLKELGAAEVIGREKLAADADRPMAHAAWAAAVDTVGGGILSGVLSQMQYGGMVACCGMVAGADLNTSVYPFILRSVSLFGIDAASCSRAMRIKVWERLASEWKLTKLNELTRVCPLSAVPDEIATMLAGKQVGRTVIRLQE